MMKCNLRKLLALSAQADYLAMRLHRQQISESEYIAKLNELRRQVGLPPITDEPKHHRAGEPAKTTMPRA